MVKQIRLTLDGERKYRDVCVVLSLAGKDFIFPGAMEAT